MKPQPHHRTPDQRYEWPADALSPTADATPGPGTDAYAQGWTGEMSVAPHGELRDGTGWRVRITGTRPGGRYALVLTAAVQGANVPGCKLRAALIAGPVACEMRQDRAALVGLVRGVMLRGRAAGKDAWRIEGEVAGG